VFLGFYTYATAGGGLVSARSIRRRRWRERKGTDRTTTTTAVAAAATIVIFVVVVAAVVRSQRTPPPRTARSAATIRRVHCRAPSSSVNHRSSIRQPICKPARRPVEVLAAGGRRAGSQACGRAACRFSAGTTILCSAMLYALTEARARSTLSLVRVALCKI